MNMPKVKAALTAMFIDVYKLSCVYRQRMKAKGEGKGSK